MNCSRWGRVLTPGIAAGSSRLSLAFTASGTLSYVLYKSRESRIVPNTRWLILALVFAAAILNYSTARWHRDPEAGAFGGVRWSDRGLRAHHLGVPVLRRDGGVSRGSAGSSTARACGGAIRSRSASGARPRRMRSRRPAVHAWPASCCAWRRPCTRPRRSRPSPSNFEPAERSKAISWVRRTSGRSRPRVLIPILAFGWQAAFVITARCGLSPGGRVAHGAHGPAEVVARESGERRLRRARPGARGAAHAHRRRRGPSPARSSSSTRCGGSCSSGRRTSFIASSGSAGGGPAVVHAAAAFGSNTVAGLAARAPDGARGEPRRQAHDADLRAHRGADSARAGGPALLDGGGDHRHRARRASGVLDERVRGGDGRVPVAPSSSARCSATSAAAHLEFTGWVLDGGGSDLPMFLFAACAYVLALIWIHVLVLMLTPTPSPCWPEAGCESPAAGSAASRRRTDPASRGTR